MSDGVVHPAMVRPVLWSWSRASFAAVLVIWVPSLLPLVIGTLASQRSGWMGTYLQCLPLLPGVFPSMALGMQETWFYATAAAMTAVLLFFVTWLLRTSYYKAFVAIVVAVAAGVHALVFAELLRQ